MSHTAPHSTVASGSSTPVLPASSSDPQLAATAAATSASTASATSLDPSYTYAAPPIPSSFKASIQAWWRAKPVEDAAHAELHLYRPSGYFGGATVANAPADDGPLGEGRGLARALERARQQQRQSSGSSTPQKQHHHQPSSSTSASTETPPRLGWLWRRRQEDRVTIATREAEDGKVGAIRFVDLGPASSSSSSSSLGDGSTLSRFKERVYDTAAAAHRHRGSSSDEILNDNLEAPSGQPGGATATTAEALVNGGGYTPPAGRKINMLEIGLPYSEANRSRIEGETKVVLLHGYGAGTAFFFQNLRSLASLPASRLYALDWLGMGRSSRPSFHIPASSLKTTESRVLAAESFFVDSLEEWRRKLGIDRMVLVGHSLGGYLSLAYALRYPQRVQRLVLVSPVGIPQAPVEATDSASASASASAKQQQQQGQQQSQPAAGTATADEGIQRVQEEVKKPQQNIVPPSRQAGHDLDANAGAGASTLQRSDTTESGSSVSRKGQSSAPERSTHEPPRFSKTSRTLFAYLWEQNFSPFGILRSSFFFGPYFAGKYTSRRFGALPQDQLWTLHSYCQAIFMSRGSGEYCLAHLLKPGAYARLPMVDRISSLAGIPIAFMYGQHDWMDVSGGRRCVRILNAHRAHDQPRASCFVVPSSGHHIYLDNADAFDTLLRDVLEGNAD